MYSENTLLHGSAHPSLNSLFYTGNVAYDARTAPNSGLPRTPTTSNMSSADYHVALDNEQRISVEFEQEADRSPSSSDMNTTQFSRSASFSQGDAISASPAAMFLSAFSPSVPAAPLPDAEGQVVSGYTFGDIIGHGGFSIIRRAFSTSGGVVAVKIARRSDLVKQGNATVVHKRLKREAAIWSSLSHEHILPLFSVVHTPYADYFFTLFCPAGSLFDILKRDGRPALPQDDAGMMFRQVVRGLRYLHEVVMSVHRDIKLENVLVDEMGVCRIGDFGMTRKIGELDEEDESPRAEDQGAQTNPGGVHRAVSLAAPSSKRQTRPSLPPHLSTIRQNSARHRNSTSSAHPAQSVHIFQPGSLPYAAPELLLPQISGLIPHPAQDIWALGVLLYALLKGQLPFADSFEPRLQMKILNGTVT